MEAQCGGGGNLFQGGVLVNGDGSARGDSGAGKVEVEEETVGSKGSSVRAGLLSWESFGLMIHIPGVRIPGQKSCLHILED